MRAGTHAGTGGPSLGRIARPPQHMHPGTRLPSRDAGPASTKGTAGYKHFVPFDICISHYLSAILAYSLLEGHIQVPSFADWAFCNASRLDKLREVVPHSERANTASFLEEVIHYVTGLQKRVQELEAALQPRSQQAPQHLNLEQLQFLAAAQAAFPSMNTAGPAQAVSQPALPSMGHLVSATEAKRARDNDATSQDTSFARAMAGKGFRPFAEGGPRPLTPQPVSQWVGQADSAPSSSEDHGMPLKKRKGMQGGQ